MIACIYRMMLDAGLKHGIGVVVANT